MERINNKNLKVGDEILIFSSMSDNTDVKKGIVLSLLEEPQTYEITSIWFYTISDGVGYVNCNDISERIVRTGHNYDNVLMQLRAILDDSNIKILFTPEEE